MIVISAPMPHKGYTLTDGKPGAYARWTYWRADMYDTYLKKYGKEDRLPVLEVEDDFNWRDLDYEPSWY